MMKMSQGLYSGFVISTIGQNAGKRIPMPFHIAQSNVAAGTARWDVNETPVPRVVTEKVAEREAKEAELAARAEKRRLDLAGGDSVTAAMRDSAKHMTFVSVLYEIDGVPSRFAYLARPFPKIALADEELVDDGEGGLLKRSDDGGFTLSLANATARYSKIEDRLYSLTEWTSPEVDIPADWRDLHHLKIIAMAKAIRGATAPASMPKADAIAIIEEWIKDDSVREDQPAAGLETGRPSEGSEAGNSLDPDGSQARARAAEKAIEFADEDGGE